MKSLLLRTSAAVVLSTLLNVNVFSGAARAVTFDQTEIDQSRVVAIAVPRSSGGYQLLVVQQVTNARQCWGESGSSPVLIDPLLLNFDFTGICSRATDSNGYSIRMGGVDLALQYSLSLQASGGDVRLVGSSRTGSPPLVIGRTNGQVSKMMKIILEPGWRFAKRAYQGQTLGHFYFTNNSLPPGTNSPSPSPTPGPSPSPSPTPRPSPSPTPVPGYSFRDIASDIYGKEIEEAAKIGFVAGFDDNTFRPNEVLTREQLVSLVLESLKKVPGANINLPPSISTSPYRDVETSRWSAAKIQWAKQNNIISGYEDGTFKPGQSVTRAELIAVMRRAAEYGLKAQGKSTTLSANQPIKEFSDTQNHWAAATIRQLSGYCKVASPLNETGNQFYPDSSAKRNYAAAATLRMLKCVKPN